MHHSHFNYEVEDHALGKDALEDELIEKYDNDFDKKKGYYPRASQEPPGMETDHNVGRLQGVRQLPEGLKVLQPGQLRGICTMTPRDIASGNYGGYGAL
jgi:hypothetical protein